MKNFSFTDLSDCEFFPHIVIFLISALIWFAFLFIDILKAIFKAPKKDKLIKELRKQSNKCKI
ncbi:hypothetical protein CIG2463D_0821 [Campylobacter iguaniorum]|uniref:hypothetical protein n=1 Tax=Campylobacter iguaniorum TaxID=1244531 RepID=UPI00073A105D|nr:hypothetical protein [Campylobacter iguaniorum]ALV24398.1 hypothetical protein CIG2463D_0821 [Campylobacter iguaniorum]